MKRALTIIALLLAMASTAGAASTYRTMILTPDGPDTYALAPDVDGFTVAAPATNAGGNLRATFYREGSVQRDESSCATWEHQSDVTATGAQQGITQQGIA